MFVLKKNVDLYTPEHRGICDVLLWNDRVFKIGQSLTPPDDCTTVDCGGAIMIPGIVDSHVHITGGGGEGGFTTRTTEITFDEAVEAGVTTMVGVLGTDGYGRQPKEVLIKCLQLNEQGIETYMLTGSYTLPVVNIMGEVALDIIYIEKCIGCGEFALADHRGSTPTKEEVRRIACDTRNAGRLAGKKGVLNIHLGNYEDGIPMIMELIREDISLRPVFVPTHVGRRKIVFDQAMELLEMGGYIDMTAGSASGDDSVGAVEGTEYVYEKFGSLDRVTWTSDGCGSLPVFDKLGNLISIEKGTSKVMLQDLRRLMERGKVPLEKALAVMTTNPAANYGMRTGAGTIAEGGRANLLLLNKDYTLRETVLGGKCVFEAK